MQKFLSAKILSCSKDGICDVGYGFSELFLIFAKDDNLHGLIQDNFPFLVISVEFHISADEGVRVGQHFS